MTFLDDIGLGIFIYCLIMTLLSTLFIPVSTLVFVGAIVCYCRGEKRDVCGAYFWWYLFPFALPWYMKKHEMLKKKWKRYALIFLSPLFLSYIPSCITIFIGLGGAMSSETHGVPPNIVYLTASDLEKVTGVAFPVVTPVDSLCDWRNNYTRVTFVSLKPLTHNFHKRLDKACTTDSCCWRKDSLGYHYCIYPERPLDRTKGRHKRKVEMKKDDGSLTMVDGRYGDHVSVFVPFKGNTITIEDGWVR